MPSLIADFFKRNVTLNMGATDAARPQTAYSVATKSVAYNQKIPKDNAFYDRYAKTYRDELDIMMRDQIARAYGLSKENLQGGFEERNAPPDYLTNLEKRQWAEGMGQIGG